MSKVIKPCSRCPGDMKPHTEGDKTLWVCHRCGQIEERTE